MSDIRCQMGKGAEPRHRLISMLLIQRLADAEHVPIGVADNHLPTTPRLIARRMDHFSAGAFACGLHRVHVLHPYRHPRPMAAASPLPVTSQKNLARARGDSAEGERSAL